MVHCEHIVGTFFVVALLYINTIVRNLRGTRMKHLDYREQEDWRKADDTIYQSPIDIPLTSIQQQENSQLIIHFEDRVQSDDRIIGEQFLVQGNLCVDGTVWALERFHFHDGAEHLVDGKRYDAEIHFVFQRDNQTLVLAVFGETANNDNGIEVQNIYDEQVNAEGLMKLIPDNRSYYRYTGSLTTPPLGQNINWLVLTSAIQISKQDKAFLHADYPNNYREVQDLNGREIDFFPEKK